MGLYFPALRHQPNRLRIEKSTAPIRSKAHRDWVASHRCSVPNCHDGPIECCHVRNGLGKEVRGTSLKSGDNWTLSFCLRHHELQTDKGEAWFQRKFGVDMKAVALEFWRRSPHRSRIEAKQRRATS